MAHRQAKVKAFELFTANLWPPDVAAELKINLRTAQRWFVQWKATNVATSQTPSSSADIAAESQQAIEQTPHLSTAKARAMTEWAEEWEQTAIALGDELLLHHGKIRRRMTQMLVDESKKTEINTRILTSLSQSIVRHSQVEIAVANLSMLDVNKAFKVLEAYGYAVITPITDEPEE